MDVNWSSKEAQLLLEMARRQLQLQREEASAKYPSLHAWLIPVFRAGNMEDPIPQLLGAINGREDEKR